MMVSKERGAGLVPQELSVEFVSGGGEVGEAQSLRCHRTEGPLGRQRPGLWERLQRHLTWAWCCFRLLFWVVGKGVWDAFLLIMKIMKIIPELRS